MGVVDTLGGPRRTAVIGLLLLFSLLLLVAGAVMLGIGITRLNESREQTERAPLSFILQVQTLNVSSEDLAADFKKSVERIKVQAEDAAGQYGVVSVLGVAPHKNESAEEVFYGPFGAGDTPIAILTVAYPSAYAPSREDLTKKFEGDKFSVERTYDSSYLPTADSSVCAPSSSNPPDGPTDAPPTAPPTQPPSDRFVPCEGTFVLMLDVGSDTPEPAFQLQNQVEFVSEVLFAKNFNHFERLGLGIYDREHVFFAPGSFDGVAAVQKELRGYPRGRRAGSLRIALRGLVNENFARNEKNLQFIVFVGNVTAEQAEDAKEFAEDLKRLGGLTVITLQRLPNTVEIEEILGAKVVEWDAQRDKNPPEYEKLFYSLYGCPDSDAENDAESDLEAENAVVARNKRNAEFEEENFDDDGDKWVPCKGQINIIVDTSNVIPAADFERQKSFFISQLFAGWTHFERLVLGYYDSVALVEVPGRVSNEDTVKKWFSALQQSKRKPSLRHAIKEIIDTTKNNVHDLEQYYIVFVSQITQQIVDEVQEYINDFHGHKITFVAVNGADPDLLKKLVFDVIVWENGKDAPDNWHDEFWKAYGCSGDPDRPTGTPPTPPTTTTTTTTTTTHPDTPQEPCRRQVYIAIDSSSGALNAAQYKAQKDLIISDLLNTFNHYERISIGHFDQFSNFYAPGTYRDLNAVRSELSSIGQNTGRYGKKPVLRRLYDFFSSHPYESNGLPETLIIFTSQIDEDQVEDSKDSFEDILRFGRVSLIGLNSNVNVTQLQKISTYSFAFDVERPPSDIRSKLQGAVLCEG